jgi:5-methylcytosine-specific restriction enzyme A
VTPSEVYYQSKHWRALRQACFDRDHGRCTVKGCHAGARVADHIETRPHLPHPTDADVLSNLRSLCLSHDAQVKERNGKRKQGGEFRVKGCDASGRSLDPNSSWNR